MYSRGALIIAYRNTYFSFSNEASDQENLLEMARSWRDLANLQMSAVQIHDITITTEVHEAKCDLPPQQLQWSTAKCTPGVL